MTTSRFKSPDSTNFMRFQLKHFIILCTCLVLGCATAPQKSTPHAQNIIETTAWLKQHPDALLITEANGVVFINGKGVLKLRPYNNDKDISLREKQLKQTLMRRKGKAKTCAIIVSPTLEYIQLTRLVYACGQAQMTYTILGTGRSTIQNGVVKTIQHQHIFNTKFMTFKRVGKRYVRTIPNETLDSIVNINLFATKHGYVIMVGRNAPVIPVYSDCTQKTLRCINHSIDSVYRQITALRKQHKQSYFNIFLISTTSEQSDKIARVGDRLDEIENTSIMLSLPSQLNLDKKHFIDKDLDTIESSYGYCSKSEIRTVVKKQRSKIITCLDQSATKQVQITGKWITSWNIKPNGTTSRIKIKPPHKRASEQPFEQCFNNVLRSMRFKPGKRVCFVTYPFNFNE